MAGTNANAFFLQKLVERKKHRATALVSHALLSMGSIGYYMNGELGWKTRLFIYNHFALLNDDNFGVFWEALFYSKDGRLLARKEGKFTGPETKMIEVADIGELDTYGIVVVHIKDADQKYMLHDLYSSVFYTQYYLPGTTQTVMAHCLSGAPKASHYTVNHMSTSWVTPAGFRPYLFLANSCRFQKILHRPCGRADITFINHEGKKKTITLPPFKGLVCLKIDLFEKYPELREHLGVKPYAMKVVGKNILHKPFLLQTDGKVAIGEHL